MPHFHVHGHKFSMAAHPVYSEQLVCCFNVQVFDDLPEIWYWNRNFEDERIVTNFIVVGPVSNHMHVVTGIVHM